MHKLSNGFIIIFLITITSVSFAVEISVLEEVEGFYIFDVTYVDGEFEGADYDKVVQLENGMIFKFQDYSYSYSYRPETVVFVKRYVDEDKNYDLYSYRLLIGEELYDVNRIK